MDGWLIVNNFVKSEKSKILREMLLNAAKDSGFDMQIKKTGELNIAIGDKYNSLPDFAVFWDKDIHLAERLEASGLRLFNSAFGIEMCDNKVLTYMRLAKANIKFPQSYASPKAYTAITDELYFAENACKKLGFPVVIKEAFGSFGQQVYLANNFDEVCKIIAKIGNSEFIIQKFIAKSKGRDVRVNVVGGKVIASMYRYNDNDFRSNISNGGNMKPYSINAEQEELAINACKALGLDFGGVDILFDEDGATVCEVNSNPHFKSTYDCTGVDMSKYIMRHIKESL